MSTPTMTSPLPTVDRIVTLLCKLGWLRDRDLSCEGKPDRPVFRRKGCVVVVGPLWVTHYVLVREKIKEQDSIRTTDFHSVEAKIKEMCRG